MIRYDLLIRGGILVLPDGPQIADLGVVDGRIAAIAPELPGEAAEEISVVGLHVFPGLIDAHVHFNGPGRDGWEGWASGSRALAAGGGTVAVEMPLNAHPPTINAAAFQQKLATAEAESLTDFALWGGLVPGNRDDMDELADLGVIGFKAFMSRSGTDDFQAADDLTLFEGMQRAAQLGLPVAVHAESDTITAHLAERALREGRGGVRDYLASRPIIAELEAIQRAITLAEEAGCKLYIVHVSSGRGVALIAAARARGVDVSAETCPHYLILTDDDVEQIGAAAKCAPPLRDAATQADLWAQLLAGNVDIIGSDHSPAPPEMKTATNFFAVWGGIAGIQSTLPILLDAGHHQRRLPLARIAALLAGNPAARLGLASRKGNLSVGSDADLVLVDLQASHTLQTADLHDRHRFSPYVGRTLRGTVQQTILRGRVIFRDGTPVSGAGGHLVRPSR